MGLASDLSDDISNFLQQPQPDQPSSTQSAPAGPARQLVEDINKFTAGIPPIPTHEDLASIKPPVTQSGPLAGTAIGNWAAQHEDVLKNAATGLGGPFRNFMGVDPAAAPYLGAQGIDPTEVKPLNYKPETYWGNVGQRTLETAPLAALGGGGIGALLTRETGNLTGNMGGEGLRELFPNHPIIADAVGSLLGSTLPTAVTGIAGAVGRGVGNLFGTGGSVERKALDQFSQNPSAYMPMDAIDETLKQHVSPGMESFVTRAPEDLKREAVGKIMGITPPTEATGPGFADRMIRRGYDRTLAGVGLASGGAVDGIMHLLGIPLWPGVTEGLGLGAGEFLQHQIKPYLDNRAAVLGQRVGDTLKNNPAQMYQMYQAQQQAPGIVSRLLGGYAPALNVPGMGY